MQKQETWGFPAFGMGVGLWLTISSLPRRRLVLNHTLGMYHFSIQGRTVCQGPMHLVYVRLALSSDGEAWGGRQSEGHHASEGETSWGGEGRAGGAPPPEPPARSFSECRAEQFAPLQPMGGASSSWF